MADHEDKDVDAEGNLRIEIATLFSELSIAIEALVMGIRTVLQKAEAVLVKAELEILAMPRAAERRGDRSARYCAGGLDPAPRVSRGRGVAGAWLPPRI